MLCAFGPASRPNIWIFGNSLKNFQHTSCAKDFWDQLEWTQIVKTATDDRDVDNKSWSQKCWSADDWVSCKARWRRFLLCFGGNNTKRWQKKQQIAEHLRFLDFVFRALSSFETHANAQNIYHHIKCKIMSLFKKKLWKKTPLRISQLQLFPASDGRNVEWAGQCWWQRVSWQGGHCPHCNHGHRGHHAYHGQWS